MTAVRQRVVYTFLLAAVLLSAPYWRHSDYSDAHLYRVIGRHLVEDGTWTAPRYLPNVYPRFYEHLPFGLWIHAATIRGVGEAGLPWVFGAISLGVIALAWWLGARLAGQWAGFVSALLLAITPNVFVYGAMPLLDPPLVLLTTAAVGLLLLWPTDVARTWIVAALLTLAATAIKGPFGLLPFCAAVFARAVVDRSLRVFVTGAVLAVVIAAPIVAFVALSEDWRAGYGTQQLLASAAGQRRDGTTNPLYPFIGVAQAFWPGLPLLMAPLLLLARWPKRWAASLEPGTPRRALLLLGWTIAAILLGLCLPGRKLWRHGLIVYPLLAVWIGVAVAGALERWTASGQGTRRLRIALGVLSAVAVLFVSTRAVQWILPAPCIGSRSETLTRELRPGEDILVVHPTADWRAIAAFAAEFRAVPWKLTSFDEVSQWPDASHARWAVVREELWAGHPPEWIERERADGWVVAARGP